MKNLLRYVISGLALGFVVTLASGCTSNNQSQCNATSCADGCCDATAKCVKPADQGAASCGTGTAGAACTTCATGQTCSANKCQGTATTTPNAACTDPGGGPCTGCCDGTTCVAVSAQSAAKCGVSGAACASCGAQACNSGTCGTTSTWPGCYSASGTPFPGNSNAQCGKDGATCTACATGQACVDKACVTQAVACGPTNCDGCCRPDGQCDASGSTMASCGKAGAACRACQTGQICSNQTCALDLGTVTTDIGKACALDTECGTGFTCRKFTGGGTAASAGKFPYPGGVCTKVCNPQTANTCGTGAVCLVLQLGTEFVYGETEPICFAQCNDTKPCREPDYTCVTVQANQPGICLIDPPADKLGNACTTQTNDCDFPPLSGGCIPESNQQGAATGFTGGYCTADCSDKASICGANGLCIPVSQTTSYCFQKCAGTGQSTCRTGYVCDVMTGAGERGCWPDCNILTGSCPTGTTCNANGYCQ